MVACNGVLLVGAMAACGPLSEATTAQIQALLDFPGPTALAAWLVPQGLGQWRVDSVSSATGR
jgi:hypothetical protein